MTDTRLRICLLSREYPPQTGWGGIGTYVYFVSHALADAGHEVHVISRSDRKEEYQHADGPVTVHRIREQKAGGPIGDWLCRWLPLSDKAYSRRAAEKAFELHAQAPLDVIEAPEYRAEAWHLVRKSPAPVVVKTHTPTFMLEQLNATRSSAAERAVKEMEADAARRAHALSSPSQSLADILRSEWKLNGRAIRVLPYPIDTGRLPAQPWAGGTPTALFIGRFEQRKGVHVLVEALPEVVKRVPNAKLRLAGGHAESIRGADRYTQALRDRIRALGLDAHVEFLGWQKRDALPALYQSAWAVVVPSLYDNYPNVCLEAMASARPVVGTRVGGIPEMVQDGASGWLVKPEDASALATALIEALGNEAEANRRGEAGRRFVSERLSPARIAQETAAFYREVIERARGEKR